MKKIACFFAALLMAGAATAGTVMDTSANTVNVYPEIKAPGFQYPTNVFEITANGQSVPVREFKPLGNTGGQYYDYAQLAIGGSVTFIVDAKEPITTWSISPKNYQIQGTVNGSTLTFTLSTSQYVAVNINRKTALYILADPLEKDVPPASGNGIHNVTEPPYQADSTGGAPVTAILQNAIDQASAAGGGIVYFPAGTYVSSTLLLKSNVSLYFAPGAVLLADDTRQNWSQGHEVNSFLMATQVSNVKIYGRGVIACRGVYLNGYKSTRQSGQFRIVPLSAEEVDGLTLDGVTMNDSTGWTVDIRGASHAIAITNLKILNNLDFEWNDGIDICGSYDARVEHGFVLTCDDAACVKAIDDPVYHVVFNDMVMSSTHSSGLKVGMQADADISNITASNFNVLRCTRGFDLSHWYGNGNWHDIRFTDWRVEKETGGPAKDMHRGNYYEVAFRMEIAKQTGKSFGKKQFAPGTGPISNIEATNIIFDGPSPNTPYLWGDSPSSNISNVTLTNLMINGKKVTDADISIKENTQNIVVRSTP